ncbi:unnamed protein product [Linum trigynum]|uniref:Uncharacterized protein n=1 Tax=Linum trigynum TaxID=586398 RepID=A0AAV2CFG8_9ROSI
MRQFHQHYQEWVTFSVDRIQRFPIQPMAMAPDCPIICMWDGETKVASHSAGGMIVMNQAGEISLAKGVQFIGIHDPLVAEFCLSGRLFLGVGHLILWRCDSKGMLR